MTAEDTVTGLVLAIVGGFAGLFLNAIFQLMEMGAWPVALILFLGLVVGLLIEVGFDGLQDFLPRKRTRHSDSRRPFLRRHAFLLGMAAGLALSLVAPVQVLFGRA